MFYVIKLDLRHSRSPCGWRVSACAGTAAEIFTFAVSLVARIGGTVGAITTCPLEVVKTRLQSSGSLDPLEKQTCVSPLNNGKMRNRFFIYRFIRHIVETEGTKALFKGLGPNLIGVAPSRSV